MRVREARTDARLGNHSSPHTWRCSRPNDVFRVWLLTHLHAYEIFRSRRGAKNEFSTDFVDKDREKNAISLIESVIFVMLKK